MEQVFLALHFHKEIIVFFISNVMLVEKQEAYQQANLFYLAHDLILLSHSHYYYYNVAFITQQLHIRVYY